MKDELIIARKSFSIEAHRRHREISQLRGDGASD